MSIPLNRYGFVIRGIGRMMSMVWLIERTAEKVRYQAPNPWAFRDGDARAGWSKPQNAPLKDLLEHEKTNEDVIKFIESKIGKPPSFLVQLPIEADTESSGSGITRLWKAMGQPAGMKDSELLRRAASRLNQQEKLIKMLQHDLKIRTEQRDAAEDLVKKLARQGGAA